MTMIEDLRLARLSEICLALPGATRQELGEHAAFLVRGRKFAYFLSNHHGDGRIAVTCRALPEEQEALLALGEERFFKPAYLGPRGWIGIRLDLDPVDWDEVADFVTDSYESALAGNRAGR
jgi:predicted DNA-binding protein (MmcQ/YjbR family)